MEWSRTETIMLAKQSCIACLGTGSRAPRPGPIIPCNCVLRSVFRVCYGRFRHCAEKEKHISQASLERVPGPQHRFTWGRKDEEYLADFVLISRRTLTAEEYRIFNYHYLLGASWKLCCIRLNLSRGAFFHEIYRVEQKLGRAFRETEPYGLFPLDQYFGDTVRAQFRARHKPPGPAREFPRGGLARAC